MTGCPQASSSKESASVQSLVGLDRFTAHHARYYARDLTRKAPGGLDRLSMSLFDASVDLNPHQVEAALFALQSPLSNGVMLADEVGLGKTIEAGLVLCQLWAECKRRLLVICPASLRKQWELELSEKFNLPSKVLDAKGWRESLRQGEEPLQQKVVLIISSNFAHTIAEQLQRIAWDLVVIDEAHKLRNAYRPGNKVGQSIRNATKGCRKLLLAATPLQNSLLELYGLSTLIDEHLFGGVEGFRGTNTWEWGAVLKSYGSGWPVSANELFASRCRSTSATPNDGH
jgi:SNF2 family DNA or RNA helicase